MTALAAVPRPAPSSIQLRSSRPGPAFRPFVDHFGFRAMRLGDAQMYHPLPARNDCFLELYFEDRFRVINVATGAIHKAPRVVLVGPHSRRREDIHRHPAREINNRAESADDVLGRSILELEQRMAAAPVSAWRGLAEGYLLERLLARRPPSSRIRCERTRMRSPSPRPPQPAVVACARSSASSRTT